MLTRMISVIFGLVNSTSIIVMLSIQVLTCSGMKEGLIITSGVLTPVGLAKRW